MEKQTAKAWPKSTLLLFLFVLLIASPLYAKDLKDYRVTLFIKNEKLEQVFKLIEAQVPFKFVYNASFISSQPPVSFEANKEPLDKVLALLVASFHGTVEQDGNNILIGAPRAEAKPSVSGRITGFDNAGVADATVSLKRSKAVTETDGDGNFSLPLQSGSDSLLISHVGYRDTGITVSGNKTFLLVKLAENIAALQQVVVNTGYQTLPKERATGSFAFVDNALFNRRVSSDVVGRLEGLVPGLLFNRNTTASASGQTDISIRGHSTLFANDQPLIVVDNFPYDGDLSTLNPNDVENITVLKDAAAASIWGVRSGNGVIVVTTKKGKRNEKLSVEMNANLTIGRKPDLYYNPGFLPSKDFINIEETLFSKGFYDGDLTSSYHTPVTPVVQLLANERAGLISQADAGSQINALANRDVRKDLSRYFYQPLVNQQYAVNLGGGGQNSDYFFSMGYDAGQANQAGNSSGRFTLNSSYHFYPAKNLQFSAGISYVASSAKLNSPIFNINTTGKGKIYPYAQLTGAIVKDYAADYINAAGPGQFLDWNYRPLDELRYADNNTTGTETRMTLGLQYLLPAHIIASLHYQYEKALSAMNNYYSDSTYYTRNLINQYSQNIGGNITYPVPIGGILQQATSTLTSHHLRGQLDYTNRWRGRHELSAIAGAEISEAINETGSNTAYGYDKTTGTSNANMDFSGNYTLNPSGSARIPNTLGFGKTTDHDISYFTNAAYTFNGLYTVSASGRIDKSNLFGVNANQRAVPLYSAGFAWNLSREKFYHLNWLPYAKLRATYGYNGNIDKSATAVTTIQQYSNSFYYGTPFAGIANPGNPDLRWEKIRMVNFGLDFGFGNQTVSGSIEYYSKKGINLFGNAPLPPSTGLTSFFGNTAGTKGHGLDLMINTRNIVRKNFSWVSSFLLSNAIDKVSKYDVTVTSNQYIGFANASAILPLTGKPIFALYSYRWAGLDPNTGDPQGYLGKTVSKDYSAILAGTSVDSMVYSGPSRPTVFGSFSNTFTFKRLSLSFNIIYKLGYYFRRSSYLSSGLPWSGNTDYYNRWQKPGDELHTNVPSVQYPPYDNNRDVFYEYSSALVDKGDHIRLQDISIGYNLGKGWRLYGYVNNVGILWRANHDHLDPDLATNSGFAAYPVPRTYAIGINAHF